MNIYLVGGAVRDKLLGKLPNDHDWVVVGSTPEAMLNLGYKPILNSHETQDFPVFLHPETKEEYALARCERRVGLGHTGFEFDVSPTITLIDDLRRRDLTINAMALPEKRDLDKLIDPYNGKADLENHILRHVSPSFVEDPLRLVRTARFAACLGFQVAPETMKLMEQMVVENKLSELSSERIWKEMERALMGTHPQNFFDVLKKCGADSFLFPHTKLSEFSIKALQRSADHKDSAQVRFAILMHELTKEEIIKFCKQFNIPHQYRDLALLTRQHLAQFQQVPELNAEGLLDLLTKIGALHSKERFKDCLHVFARCTQEPAYEDRVHQAFQAATSINTKELSAKYIGHEISRKIKISRIEAIQQWINNIETSSDLGLK